MVRSRTVKRSLVAFAVLIALTILTALPVSAAPRQQTVVNICDRTPEVQTAILVMVSGATCSTITSTQLAGITGALVIVNYSSTSIDPSEFAGLTGVEELLFLHSAIETLHPGAFQDLTSLEKLSLDQNRIKTLEDGVFRGLTSLTELRMAQNRIQEINAGAFNTLTALETLSLYSNNITSLDANTFASLTALTNLELNNNPISSLHVDTFDPLTSLTSLNLSDLSLPNSAWDEDLFASLTNLTDLRFVRNGITTLDVDIFDDLTNLETLDIRENAITALPDGIFDGLTSLETLYLNNNALTTLPADVFDELTALQLLYLNNNSLSSLPTAAFAGLTSSLTTLYLHRNSLPSLHVDVFDGLTGLTQLALSYNELTTVPEDLFDETTALQYLYLNNNMLSSVPENTFDGLTSLIWLYLSNNNLASLNVNLFDETAALQLLVLHNNTLAALDATIFDSLTALNALYLHGNSLSTLDADLFDGLTALDTLYLSDNSLSTLHADLFDGLGALRILYLNDNGLTALPATLFEDLDDSLQQLVLTDNSIAALPAMVFAGLTGLKGLDLSCNGLTALDLSRFDPFASSLTYLDITGNSFTAAPTDAAVRAKLTSIANLYISEANTECLLPDERGLSGLTVSVGMLEPAFEAPGFTGGYGVYVAYDVSSIVITPTTTDPHAAITSTPADIDPDTPGIQVNLPTDRTRVDFTVTAENGVTTRTFFIEVFRDHPPATNARLSDLTLSGVTVTESFGSRTYAYTATTSLATTTVTPELSDRDATAVIKLGGVTDADGTVNLAVGTNVITVEVTAEDGTTQQTYTVTVTRMASNFNPMFSAETATRTLPENSGAGVNVAGGAITATDSDNGDTLTYSLTGTDAGSFEIDSSGQISTKTGVNQNFNFEDMSNNSFSVTVNVRDSKDQAGVADTVTDDTIAVTINLTNVNEAPVITTDSGVSSIFDAVENTATTETIKTFEATDVDANSQPTWDLQGADAGDFTITKNADGHGELRFASVPNFEMPVDAGTNNEYNFTVRVRDNGTPRKSATHAIRVTVTDVNEAPEITTVSTTYTDFNVDENTTTTTVIKTYEATDVDASTTLTWSLEGNDAGDFTITKNSMTGDGELRFRNVPNFETPVDADTSNDYDIRVKVKDDGIPGNRGASNQLDDAVSVVVNVQDVNEAPVVSGGATPSFAEIEYDATSPDLTIETYTYTDQDRNPDDTITWGLSGTESTHFGIGSMSGVLSFDMRPDFENPFGADNVYVLVVEADDGEGGVGTFNVTVTVTNVDETPEITTTAASHTAPSFMEIEYDATTAELTVADYDGRDEEDGQTITWSKAGADAGDFTIDTSTGVLSFVQRPNFEMPVDAGTDNVYNVTVRATDTTSPLKTRDLVVTVTVTNVNERPDISEDTVPSYVEIEYDFTGTRPDVHTFTATDYDDGDTFIWTLEGVDAAYLEIGATSGILTFKQDSGFGHGPLPSFEHPRDDAGDGSSNTYTITVRATDDDAADQKFTEYAVVVTVTDVNEAPEFTGTPNAALTPDEHDANTDYVVMDLVDYDARDEEGTVTWSLTGTDRRDFAISADGVVTFDELPNYEEPQDSGGDNVYEFTVVATDVQSGSSRRNASIAVTVTVGDVEEAGTLTVDNLSPAVGETVTFMLTDPDGGIDSTIEANIRWSVETMTPGGSWGAVQGVVNPTSTTLTYTVHEDDTGKAIRAVVTYRDRRGPGKTAESEGTAEATANPITNAPPRFRGGSTFSVEEGAAGRTVGDPIPATDRDPDTLTFGIQSSGNSNLFEIDPSSGQVRTAAALDFETTSGFLTFTVTLHDGRDADGNPEDPPVIDVTRTIIVFVTDVEEDGVVTLSDDEPGVGTPLTATLEDGDGGVTGEMWQWARSQNGRTGWTNISGATFSGYMPTQGDAEFFLRATVIYTDRRGGGKNAEANTTQRVFGENQRPTFPSTEDGQRTVPEKTPASANIGAPVAAEDPENGGLTYALSGTDAAAFTIVETTGQIRVKDALDFETKSSYSVTVDVHDGLDGSGNTSTTVDDSQDVTITVENVEELGEVTLTTPTGTIQARAEVTAALSDDDGPTGVTWQWSRSPNGRTDWFNIQGATSATYTPTLEGDRGNYIRATATYTDGHGPNKTAEKVSARVGDPPPVNSAPVFPSTENGQREVAEDAADGTAVGDPVAATDLNAGDAAVNDPLAYTLSGTDAAAFTVDPGTGQLRLAQGVTLDFEGKRTYRVTVEVTDGRDENGGDDMAAIDARQSVTITVTNVNEAPVVTGDATAPFEENSSSAVASYTATDPERDTLTWTVSGNDFWISDRGQLHFRSPPSFEQRTSYTVTVAASDGTLSNSLDVNITVSDLEEEGTVTIEPPRGWDGTTFTAGLDDDDGGETNINWQWEWSPNGRSSWTDIAGATDISYEATADDVGRYLRASASYEDRRNSGKEASAALTGRIEDSTDRPIANNAPAFTESAPVARSVGQGTSAGRTIGAPVRATDEDTGDVLTYSLDGTDANLFDIDPATGQIRTKAILDYDPDPQGQNTYTVTVSVHDGFGPSYNPDPQVDATITVTITVTAVAQRTSGGSGGGFGPAPTAPKFVDGFRTTRPLAVTARVGDAVGDPVSATHPNDSSVTYSLSGADAALFTVDEETGQVRLGQGVTLALGQTYTVNLTATDSSGTGAIIIVDIVVAEAPYHRYDLNRNGSIEKNEVLAAVSDYFAGVIEKPLVLEVVSLYFAG